MSKGTSRIAITLRQRVLETQEALLMKTLQGEDMFLVPMVHAWLPHPTELPIG